MFLYSKVLDVVSMLKGMHTAFGFLLQFDVDFLSNIKTIEKYKFLITIYL